MYKQVYYNYEKNNGVVAIDRQSPL